jgi:hypothetical protein
MGYAYDELIAPAVLLDNPGLTREEFVELLDQTHSSSFHEYDFDCPWGNYTEDTLNTYHEGIEGLASILGLKFSRKYKKFKKLKKDENGLGVEAPIICHLTAEEQKKLNKKVAVLVHLENKIEAEIAVQEYSYKKLKAGDIWEDIMDTGETGLVTKIIEEKYHKDEDEFSPGPEYYYKLRVKPIKMNYNSELFESEEELYKKWPQFHPDYKYEWSQKEGKFTTIIRNKNCFYWINKNGKYYIDEKSFDIMPASSRTSDWILGYTDLILTAEAVKKKAWKLISYRGLKHLGQFLKDFPDSRIRYERAVWDSHTSLGAKHIGMTVSEFLRFRLLPP